MFIWNGKKLAFNFLDADMMKKFSDAGKEMWKIRYRLHCLFSAPTLDLIQ